jgi:hypothetical protein
MTWLLLIQETRKHREGAANLSRNDRLVELHVLSEPMSVEEMGTLFNTCLTNYQQLSFISKYRFHALIGFGL